MPLLLLSSQHDSAGVVIGFDAQRRYPVVRFGDAKTELLCEVALVDVVVRVCAALTPVVVGAARRVDDRVDGREGRVAPPSAAVARVGALDPQGARHESVGRLVQPRGRVHARTGRRPRCVARLARSADRLRCAPTHAQAYVALSRARSLEGLHVASLPQNFSTDPVVVAFYDRLEAKSSEKPLQS